MADQGQNFQNQGIQNALAEIKLRLYAPPQQGAQRRPSLRVQVYSNCPRLVVKTNVDGDRDDGIIRGDMDGNTFFTFLELVKFIMASAPGTKRALNNKNHRWYKDKETGRRVRSEEVHSISKTVVGKDDKGVVYIALVADNRPKIKFEFLNTKYHELENLNDGGAMDPGEASVLYAGGWMEQLKSLVPIVQYHEYKHIEFGNKQGNGSQGGNNYGNNNNRGNYGNNNRGNYNNNRQGGNQGGGNSGGGQSSNSVTDNFDDDIPF